MKHYVGTALVAAVLLASTAAHADTLAFNSAPNDVWSYGNGNNYAPSNTAVLTTDANSQLYLRLHQTFVQAPASDAGGVYSFALGTPFVSFDWGVDNNTAGFGGVGVQMTLTNVGTGQSVNFDPILFGFLDNASIGGSLQNSARLNWFPIGFDPNVDDTYKVQLDVTGLAGGAKSLAVYAKLGAGAAVPEPASWAMLIAGFSVIGVALRRRRVAVSFA
jgi:hypothetical protein